MAADYSTFSTRTLEKMLARAAAGSAEHKVLREELRARGEYSTRRDTGTRLLFGAEQWGGMARRKR